MKSILYLLLLALNVTAHLLAQNDGDLIPVRKDNCWQYINNTGKVVIKGPFNNAAYFSEGLAAVREGGHYGYINPQGAFAVSPQYDFASAFKGGYAKVVKEAQALVIDHTGKIIYKPAEGFEFSRPESGHIILGHKNNYGLYDLTGKWLLENKYGNIEYFGDSLYVIHDSTTKYYERKSAIYHLRRGFITDFQIAEDYTLNSDGTVSFESGQGKEEKTVVLSSDGKEIFHFGRSDVYTDGSSEEGFIRYYTYGDKEYANFINVKGKTLYKDHELRSAKDFSHGRAFVKFRRGEWRLIDKTGKILNKNEFDDVGHFRKSGNDLICLTSWNNKWGLIDSTGNFIVQPKYKNIDWADPEKGICIVSQEAPEKEELYALYAELRGLKGEHNGADDLDKEKKIAVLNTKVKTLQDLFDEEDPSDVYGLIDKTGKTILECRYKDLAALAADDVCFLMSNDTTQLFHLKNGIIYQEEKNIPKGLDTLNIDYMERGYCYAETSFPIYTNLGGHGRSNNTPMLGISQFPKDKEGLFLWVDTTRVDTFYQHYAGHPLYLVNKTEDTLRFDAQDGRLYITMQAFDKGEWKNIEYSPSSWCGNSYHVVGLLSGLYWKFTCPVYKGSNKVQLRFKLTGDRQWNPDKEKYEEKNIVYSNVFCGSINPAQLWKKKGHNPSGIMDPYNE